MTPLAIEGFGKFPVNTPPAVPVGVPVEELPAYNAYGTDNNCAAPILMKLEPPSGSISTCINFAAVLQSIPLIVPVVLSAPELPIAILNNPKLFVAIVLVSL